MYNGPAQFLKLARRTSPIDQACMFLETSHCFVNSSTQGKKSLAGRGGDKERDWKQRQSTIHSLDQT